MRVAVVGVEKSIVEKEIVRHGFVLDKLKPEIVVSFGGDGSALVAEQLYPGVPRLTIKHSSNCEKCVVGEAHNVESVIEKLKNNDYKIAEEFKVEGIVNGDSAKRLIGLNEINVAHAVPTKAIRSDVFINGKLAAGDLIGDGVLVATPYGSTAYFRTITGRKFSAGIGIALNNTNKKTKYHFADENAEIKIKLNRGPAVMCADNTTTMIPLKDGDVVIVRKAKEKARLIELVGEERKIEI